MYVLVLGIIPILAVILMTKVSSPSHPRDSEVLTICPSERERCEEASGFQKA